MSSVRKLEELGAGRGAAKRSGLLPSPSSLAIAYVALCPLLIIHVGSQSFGAVDVLLVFGVFSVLRGLGGHPRLPGLLLLGFFALSIFSSAWSLMQGAPGDVLLIGRVWAIYLPFLVVMGAPQIDAQQLRRIFIAALASGSVSLVIGVALYHAGIQMRDTQQTNWYGEGIRATLRAGGMLGNTADFGHIAAIVAVAALGYWKIYGQGFLVGVVVTIALYATFLSSSRAALLHIVVAVVVLLAMSPLAKKLGAALLFVVAGTLAYGFFSKSLVDPRVYYTFRRLDIFNLTGESLFFATPRFETWQLMGEWILAHPFVGIGYGQTIPTLGRVGDNSFITLFLELGVVSGILITLFWITMVVEALRVQSAATRSALAALVVSEISHMVTVDSHRIWTTTPIVLVLAASMLRFSASPTPTGRGEPNP